MKKILASIDLVICGTQVSWSQNNDIRPAAIGVSFFFNDYATAQRIRSSSLNEVITGDKWSKFSEMAPGIAITYFKGLQKYIDFAGTVAYSFPKFSTGTEVSSQPNSALFEADASFNFKMFPERYAFTPYLIAGVGLSTYQSKVGAILPLGGGFKLNLYDEASVFITAQYRVPLVKGANDYHFFTSIGISGIVGKKKEEKTTTM